MTSLDQEMPLRQELEQRLIKVWAGWSREQIIRTLSNQINVEKLQRLVDHQEGT